MNENTTSKLVTVTPNEEGVSYIVIAYKNIDGYEARSNIQMRCQGLHAFKAVEDLVRSMTEDFQTGEMFQELADDERRVVLNGFKRQIIGQAAKGADCSADDLVSDLLDNLLDASSDGPEDEE